MKRRSFLVGMLAAATAPAIVRASSLMPLWIPKKEIIHSGLALLDPSGRIPLSLTPKLDSDSFSMKPIRGTLFHDRCTDKIHYYTGTNWEVFGLIQTSRFQR